MPTSVGTTDGMAKMNLSGLLSIMKVKFCIKSSLICKEKMWANLKQA
jgi:hypothetical protein